ncbi:Uncharacterised protein [Mycobacterium tuberculosis]|uniref:Uncharacterized protein n=1 Tax=Mycobacterium tuberculosis TaxID=1773 RepID=A0A655JR51_MYCTX|nr:Uncharacterised protein [Mycobacterium tuberculosis]COX43832.1 Uncharacterised protein [Mycobacterium tuberculosis]
MADRGGLTGQPGHVGGLGGRDQRVQPPRRRRGGRVTVHRQCVLSPHFAVVSLGRHDRRCVLTQDVGRHQCREQSPVGSDLRRRNRHGERRLKGGRRRHGLCSRMGRRFSGVGQPGQIRLGSNDHRHRRRTQPLFGSQLHDHRLDGRCCSAQLDGQAVPRRPGGHQGCCAGTGVHSCGVDFRG